MDTAINKTAPAGLKVWSTTFADILTLVLSFFIATVSVSPLNPASESARQRPIAADEPRFSGLSAQTAVESKSGTPLADNPSEATLTPGIEVVEFTVSDFESGDEKLTGQAVEKLKKAIQSIGYVNTSVRIESCAPDRDEARALRFGTAVRRQVFDAGGARPTVRLAVLDGDCRSLPELTGDGVARLTIRRTE